MSPFFSASGGTLLFLVLTHVISLSSAVSADLMLRDRIVSAMFVFGDSIVDSGNNNYIHGSTSFNDYLPYGIDFLVGPTGRFTNNRTVADVLGQMLGLPDFIPVFNDPNTRGRKILNGVNYASAGSGVLDTTDADSGVIPLSHQVSNFEQVTLPDLMSQFNDTDELSTFLYQSIFLFSSGANDYAYNCFEETKCSFSQLTDLVLTNYTLQLQRLYALGAQKFVLLGIQPVGCTPLGRRQTGDHECFGIYNYASVILNIRLRESLDQIANNMPGSQVVYFNNYDILWRIINDPKSFGFNVVNDSCCLGSSSTGGRTCIKNGPVCADRRTYLYFDGVHPTDATNVILAEKMYNSADQNEVYPFNVKHMASLMMDYDHAI